MGRSQSPAPVLLILAAFSRHQDTIDWARELAEHQWGPVAFTSPSFLFDQTDYYTASMGPGLHKIFFAFERLIDPVILPDCKHTTNEWEAECRRTMALLESRPLNLDPGYVTEAKLVLASTKDHAHRIYLRDGIYAEVTLFYQNRQWCCHPWTYPDYQTPAYQAYFEQCRRYLRERRRT